MKTSITNIVRLGFLLGVLTIQPSPAEAHECIQGPSACHAVYIFGDTEVHACQASGTEHCYQVPGQQGEIWGCIESSWYFVGYTQTCTT
jgi:hypothetical protein